MTKQTSNCLCCGNDIVYNASQSRGKYCNNTCQTEYQFQTIIIPKIEKGLVGERRTLRKYLLRAEGNCCKICNESTWLSVAIPLEVDHIDGDASNNLPSNLRLVCPNCHALQPTSKGRNRGRGRKSRGLRRE